MGQCQCASLPPTGAPNASEEVVDASSYQFLIVGGGTAAGYICRELVAQGVGPGAVGVVTDEPVAPYERPTLTKAYLHPPGSRVRLRLPSFHTCSSDGDKLQTDDWYKEKGITFLRGKATGVNLQARELDIGGRMCKYEKMIIATGSRPSMLTVPGAGNPSSRPSNVHYIRSERDSARLVADMEQLAPGSHIVVVGAGYIGLEAAANLVGWDFKVTIVMPGTRLIKLFPEMFASWFEQECVSRNLQFMKGERVDSLEVSNGICSGVKLQSGATLPCDAVLAAIGGQPNVEWCWGLKMERGGVAVDSSMQTSDPNVYAVGDVCAFPSQFGGTTRMEFVDHARKSAVQAAKAALGLQPEPYKYMPHNNMNVFGYSQAPISFNFFGDLTGYLMTKELRPNRMGAIWVRKGKLVGCMMMGSPGPSDEETAKLRQLAERQPDATHDVAAAFEEAGL